MTHAACIVMQPSPDNPPSSSLSFAKMEAQYFHSCIFASDPLAKQKIITDFCTAINNVAAKSGTIPSKTSSVSNVQPAFGASQMSYSVI